MRLRSAFNHTHPTPPPLTFIFDIKGRNTCSLGKARVIYLLPYINLKTLLQVIEKPFVNPLEESSAKPSEENPSNSTEVQNPS